MIVKFLKNSGGGSAKATMDYLLGKDKDREGARLLSGDPELTKRLSDSLSFQNRHTVGVLSFEEVNLPDDYKIAIRESFESCLLAGLEKDQYNITWIEHTDKDRLELNFVIANTELTTGKRLQPYYDKVDRPLVENWKQVINHEYNLTDPHDPDKAQAVKTLSSQNLPQDIRKIKEQIGQVISHQIEQGNITDRKDVIDTLQQAGFEIARQTDKSISIKNPDGKRNIRLEGIIYENRQFNEEFAEERRRARKEYAGTGSERYRTARNKLQRAIEVKQERNRASFGREYQDYQREQKRLSTSIGMENDARGTDGRSTDRIPYSVSNEHMDRVQSKEQESRISRDYTKDRAITFGSQGTSAGGGSRERWDDLYSDDRGRESEKFQQQDQSRIGNQIRLEHERLFDTLQRASGHDGEKDLTASNTDRAIDRSQSSVERTEQLITATSRGIGKREQATSDHERQADQFIEISQEKTRAVSRGIEIDF
ncbi:relaxase/mobilization nuclease domain-containing protein [Psychrobacter okhotskensis]|uniref:relaxase/mobilization nuclease domain-containing protein n=1 Tax=Psychrobacter okhotskensis TaxID=212403 RepID=UPI00191A2B98|nr:relaxase/mobilization nuclease domain-containing protein [Psychrobacter okhotskensis]